MPGRLGHPSPGRVRPNHGEDELFARLVVSAGAGERAGVFQSHGHGVRVGIEDAAVRVQFRGRIVELRGALGDPLPEARGAALRSIVRIAGAAARAVVEEYEKKETDPALKRAARAALESL